MNPHIRNLSLLTMLLVTASFLPAADRVRLAEPAKSTRVVHTTGTASASGSSQTPQAQGKSVALKLGVKANWDYREIRLPGTGRDAEAYRSLRKYDSAEARIEVAEQITNPRLRRQTNLIVAEGRTDGMRYFSPLGPLNAQELELLDTPIDELALLSLLPDDPVEAGDKWKPSQWVMQFVSGVEAVDKSDIACEVEKLDDKEARIKLTGSISGGIVGAATEITVDGYFLFDIKQQLVTKAEFSLKEKRSVSPVTTGLDISSTVSIHRSLDSGNALTQRDAEKYGTPPTEDQLQILDEVPEWNIRWSHTRKWFLFHLNEKVAVMRLLDRGSLIAQCNIAPIAPAKAGEHMDEKQFQQDVEKAIGKDFRKVVLAEEVGTKDKRYLYRIVATGETKQAVEGGTEKVIPLQWIYYLIASPTGQQVVVVFTLEPSQTERFQNQDLSFALNLQFINTNLGSPTLNK
ncbi:MAG: hypothetical protein U0903_22785 [Planctomycetales bacterium]